MGTGTGSGMVDGAGGATRLRVRFISVGLLELIPTVSTVCPSVC